MVKHICALAAVLFILAAFSFFAPRLSCADPDLNKTLAEAIKNNDSQQVMDLLKAGADPNISSGADGSTPLMIAAGEGNVKLINMLLDAGADLNAMDKNGDSVLVYAARNGRKYAIDALIEAGAPYAASTRSGQDLSDLASSAGYSHIAKDLDDRVAGMNDEVAELRIDMLDEARSSNYDNAADISLRIYDLTRGAYGEKDERTLAALNDMALMSMKAGRYDEAGEYYNRLHDYARDVYGPSSEMTAMAANNLGVYYYSRSDNDKAAENFKEAYDIASKKLGESSETTQEFHSNLLMAQGKARESGSSPVPKPAGEPGVGGTDITVLGSPGSGAETAGPMFRGGGASGKSGVFGTMGMGGEEGEDRLFGIIEWVLAFVSVLALAYFIYRLVGSLSDSSDKAKALTRFEARMSLSLGRLYEKLENYEAAASHYESGLRILKGDFHARYRLARIYHYKLYNVSRAKLHYRELIQSLPPEHVFRIEAAEAIQSINTVNEPTHSLF